jgi:hypothetical protein
MQHALKNALFDFSIYITGSSATESSPSSRDSQCGHPYGTLLGG